jgi:putative transposase
MGAEANTRNGYRNRDFAPAAVVTCYLLGVSARRMDSLVESLGITRLSTSQVSRVAADLDEQVAALRTRPMDAGSCTFLAADQHAAGRAPR